MKQQKERPGAAATVTGAPLNRVDGRQKVTGEARYAVEHNPPDIVYGVLVTSTIARGRITQLETAAAEQAPGVLAVLTHQNSPKVPGYGGEVNNGGSRVEGQELRVFYDDQVHFNNQPVALAVADTLERADKPDLILDLVGAKGLGEIGLIGLTAAIANAVYHATGQRIRQLPITPDKLVSVS